MIKNRHLAIYKLRVYMYKSVFSLFFIYCCVIAYSQKDTSFVYTSIEDALKNPEQVYKLRLSKLHLKEFPTEILQLKNLQYLDVSKNRIVKIPSEIKQLNNLRVLNISKNKIESLPDEICELIQLEKLIANQNQLVKLPEKIGDLKRLVVLDLWDTEITSLPESAQHLKNLKLLDLRHIQLNIREQESIKKLVPNAKVYFSPACNCGN